MSDLHFGARNGLDDPALEGAIRGLIEEIEPALVVVSGDLTHHGLRAEHQAAAGYLRGLGTPLLVVPGNHDIPTLPPARLVQPWRAFLREWETTNPSHSTPELEVVGLNSVNPLSYQGGRVGSGQLEAATARLRQAAVGALRIAVLHHQLAGAPWRTYKAPLARRGRVLDRLASAGVELILSGHVHQVAICERQEFEVVPGAADACVIATAPGLGRPRPDRRNEARGVLIHRVDEQAIEVETHVWTRESWILTGTRVFPVAPRLLDRRGSDQELEPK